MAKPEKVTVEYDKETRGVTIDKPEVQLYFDAPGKADSIEWKIRGCPRDLRPKILWDVMAPFRRVSSDVLGETFTGTWNTRESGVFEYAIVFVDVTTKQIVAGIDPKVRNDPGPPIEQD